MAEREVVLKLKVNVEGAQVPKIDTKLADQSLKDLEARAKQTGQVISQSIAFPTRGPSYTPYTAGYSYVNGVRTMNSPNAPGAYRAAGIAYPHIASEFNPGMRARGGFGNIMSRPSDSPYSTTRGGPALGPVSDPGSFAQSSLSTARGYDVAILRSTFGADALRDVENYGRSLDKIRLSMRSLRENVGGLAGSMALFNLSLQDQSGSTASRMQLGASALGMATYGWGAARGAQQFLGGGSALAGRAIRRGAIRVGGTSAIGRGGAALGGGLLAAAPAFGLLGAGLALGGATVMGMMAWDESRLQAERDARDVSDARAQSMRDAINMRGLMPFGMAANRAGIGADAAFGRFGIGADTYQQFTAANRSAIGSIDAAIRGSRNWAQGFGGAIGGTHAEAGAAQAQAEVQLLQEKQRLMQQAVMAAQQEHQARMQANQELSRSVQLERDRAQATASSVGRLGAAGRRRLSRLAGRNMTERNALAMEQLTGYREGSPQSEFLDRLGQQAIDADPGLRRAFGDDAKTSSELSSLQKEIQNLAREKGQLEKSIVDLVRSDIDAMANLSRDISTLQQQILEQKAQQIMNGAGR